MCFISNLFLSIVGFFFGTQEPLPCGVIAPSEPSMVVSSTTVIMDQEQTRVETQSQATTSAQVVATIGETQGVEIESEVIRVPDENKQKKSFSESFADTYVLLEAGNIKENPYKDWWLSSGGYLFSLDGTGGTILGELPESDEFRLLYEESNPSDSDNGYHPQNIFRFVKLDWWENYSQVVYYKIVGENFNDSQYRNASNGLLLFNRYQDAANLYYTGIRVDGRVVVKKKQYNQYTDLGVSKIFEGTYDREHNQNLLPTDTWLGLKTVVKTNPDDTVSISVFTDVGKTGVWTEVLSVIDDGSIGGPPMLKAGHAGIRTDFMDVLFDDYLITEL